MLFRRLFPLLLLLVLAGCGDANLATQAAAPATLRPTEIVFRLEDSGRAALNSTVNLTSGWNPVALQAPHVSSLSFSSQIAGLAVYGPGGYAVHPFSQTELNAGAGGRRGLWVFATAPTTFSYAGGHDGLHQLSLASGYNLVSLAQSAPVAGASLRASVDGRSVPPGSAVLPVFTQINADGSTTPVDVAAGGVLLPGRPYWVFANRNAVLSWAVPSVTGVSPGSGFGGTPVTLSGSGFTGASAVRFGGTPADNFTVTSDTRIVAIAPAGSGTVDVIVTGPNGDSAAGALFSYAGAPTVTSLSPNSGWVGGTSGVTLTGTGFRTATEVRFGGTPVLFTVQTDTQILCEAPAQWLVSPPAQSVPVRVVGPGGISAGDILWTYTMAWVPPTTVPGGGGTPASVATHLGGQAIAPVEATTSLVVTTTAPAQVGDLVIIDFGGVTLGWLEFPAIGDSGGNSYMLSATGTTTHMFATFYGVITTALPVGSTITVSWPTGSAAGDVFAATATAYRGYPTLDRWHSAFHEGPTTDPFIGFYFPTSSAEALLHATFDAYDATAGSTAPDFTPGAGFTALPTYSAASASRRVALFSQYRTVTTSDVYTATGTFDPASNYDGYFHAFR